MKTPGLNRRICDILDNVVQAADTRTAREIDYRNTRSSIDREKMGESREAYRAAYDQAVKRLTNLVWTGGQFIEDLARWEDIAYDGSRSIHAARLQPCNACISIPVSHGA